MGGNGVKKPLIAGNWKMNGLRAALSEIAAMAEGASPGLTARLDLLVCPPATLLAEAVQVRAPTPSLWPMHWLVLEMGGCPPIMWSLTSPQ